jgi:hypothetical protein
MTLGETPSSITRGTKSLVFDADCFWDMAVSALTDRTSVVLSRNCSLPIAISIGVV